MAVFVRRLALSVGLGFAACSSSGAIHVGATKDAGAAPPADAGADAGTADAGLDAGSVRLDAGAEAGFDAGLDGGFEAGPAACALSGTALSVAPPPGAPLRAFIGTAAAEIPLVLTLPATLPACALTATAQLSDVTGAVVATSVTVLTVTGGANAAVIPLHPPDVGYYSVALSFAGGDAPLAATYAPSVGVLNALPSIQAAEPPDQSEFGVNTHFDQGQGDPIVTSELIRLAGIRWIRDTLGWPGVEQDAGVYAISPGDLTAFATLNDAGVIVLVCLTYHNPLYAAGSAQEAVAYGKYAQYVAAALPHTVQAFEIWNEPQQSGGLTPAQYVPVLRSGYAGVKAGN